MEPTPALLATENAQLREALAGRNVLDVVLLGKGDLSDWVELMEVVEALCPKWSVASIEKQGEYRL